MPIYFTSSKILLGIRYIDQQHWFKPVLEWLCAVQWSHKTRNLVFWDRWVYNTYHAHFRFFDHWLSPVDQLENCTLHGWPNSHIPFFVPISNPHIETHRGINIGSVVLIYKENIDCLNNISAATA